MVPRSSGSEVDSFGYEKLLEKNSTTQSFLGRKKKGGLIRGSYASFTGKWKAHGEISGLVR